MAMQAQLWSVNGLSVELARDRRTIARHLDAAGVTPAGNGSKGPVYRMADAVRALHKYRAPADVDYAEGWDSGVTFMIEYLTMGPDEDGDLFAELAAAKRPAARLRLMLERMTGAAFAALSGRGRNENDGYLDSPVWSTLTDAQLHRALDMLYEGALGEDVLAMLEDSGEARR